MRLDSDENTPSGRVVKELYSMRSSLPGAGEEAVATARERARVRFRDAKVLW